MLDLVAPGNEYANLGVLSILRLARVLRLLKLLRKVKSLRELQKLVKMMHTCIKALFWSFIFCFVVMTIWAMLIVEWIDPYVRDMVEEGLFEECGVFCETATTSVMKANLLLFKTVIAGDSWGTDGRARDPHASRDCRHLRGLLTDRSLRCPESHRCSGRSLSAYSAAEQSLIGESCTCRGSIMAPSSYQSMLDNLACPLLFGLFSKFS